MINTLASTRASERTARNFIARKFLPWNLLPYDAPAKTVVLTRLLFA